MRSYPPNSPQAAARIVALTMVADGHIGAAELDLLERLAVHEQLGLPRDELEGLLKAFSEDMRSGDWSYGGDASPVDERTLADWMATIQDPALQRKLLRLCVELAEADAQVAAGESAVLVAAVEHWGLQHEMFRSPVPPH